MAGDKPLTAEREATIRSWATTAFGGDVYLTELLAEIDRLRSDLAAAREAALREARQKVRSYTHHALWGDLLNYRWDQQTEILPPDSVLHCTGHLRIACARLVGGGLAKCLGEDSTGIGQFYVISDDGRTALAEAVGKGGGE